MACFACAAMSRRPGKSRATKSPPLPPSRYVGKRPDSGYISDGKHIHQAPQGLGARRASMHGISYGTYLYIESSSPARTSPRVGRMELGSRMAPEADGRHPLARQTLARGSASLRIQDLLRRLRHHHSSSRVSVNSILEFKPNRSEARVEAYGTSQHCSLAGRKPF